MTEPQIRTVEYRGMTTELHGNFQPAREPRPAEVDYEDIGRPAVVEIDKAFFISETGAKVPVSQELIDSMNDCPESIMDELRLT